MPAPFTVASKKDATQRKWYIVDAQDRILGRLAAQVAAILRGKHKPAFSPHVDIGDHVIIINCDKIRLTGQKLTQKIYYRHSGYPGGLKEESAGKLLRERPERIVEWAVQGMLPKNKLGRAMGKKLKVYRSSEHPHAAQSPTALDKPQWETR